MTMPWRKIQGRGRGEINHAVASNRLERVVVVFFTQGYIAKDKVSLPVLLEGNLSRRCCGRRGKKGGEISAAVSKGWIP